MSRALGLAVACGFTATAAASPGIDPTAGRAVFTGATMPSATSIDLDPAALGLGLTDELYLSATALIDQFGITSRYEDAAGNLTMGPHMRDDQLGPGGMIAYIRHIGNDRGTIGVALRSDPSELFFGDHDAERYQTLGGRQRTYGISFAGSIKITNELLFGLSLDTQTTYLHLHYARDTALAAGTGPGGIASSCGGSPCGIGNPAATERYDVNVHSNLFSASDAIAVNIGLVYQIGKVTWIAAAFHAPPGLALQTELDGTMDVRQAPRDGGLLLHGGSTVYLSQPSSADAELRMGIVQPFELHVGARWVDLSRFSAYDVRGYGSTFPTFGIPEWTERPRGFHDQFAAWAGIEESDPTAVGQLRFGGRLGFETSAVDDARISPMTVAPLSATADVGVQVALSPTLKVQLSYGLQYFPATHVGKSAFDPADQLACQASGFDYSTSPCSAVRNGYAIETAAGDYDRVEHALRLGIRYELP